MLSAVCQPFFLRSTPVFLPEKHDEGVQGRPWLCSYDVKQDSLPIFPMTIAVPNHPPTRRVPLWYFRTFQWHKKPPARNSLRSRTGIDGNFQRFVISGMTSSNRAADPISLARAWASSCKGQGPASSVPFSSLHLLTSPHSAQASPAAKHPLTGAKTLDADQRLLVIGSLQKTGFVFSYSSRFWGWTCSGTLPKLFQTNAPVSKLYPADCKPQLESHAFGHVGGSWVQQDLNWRTRPSNPAFRQKFSQNFSCF